MHNGLKRSLTIEFRRRGTEGKREKKGWKKMEKEKIRGEMGESRKHISISLSQSRSVPISFFFCVNHEPKTKS